MGVLVEDCTRDTLRVAIFLSVYTETTGRIGNLTWMWPCSVIAKMYSLF